MFIFIETKLFTRLADEHLSDDDLSRLQAYLNENAETADIIRGSGGVRKLRWAGAGRGKRGARPRTFPARFSRRLRRR